MVVSVTAIAPVNIATIKYWGKRDEELILPLNDSISVTLSTDQMHAKTSIVISPDFIRDEFWLNGNEESIENPRLQKCLQEMRRLSTKEIEGIKSWKLHICSENNFPTAAGLASSSAGYACLVYGLSQIYGIKEDVTFIARQGSGSACRSMYGGFVQWHSGSSPDGSDSIATQLASATHWPNLRILILVVNETKKIVSSTVGMQRSVETSELLKYRVKTSAPKRTEEMKQAIIEKCFETFAEITMRDSNQFHAICLDTYPPAVYMNDTSHAIQMFVHKYNEIAKCNKVAYTFDAGRNACLFLLEDDVPQVLSAIMKMFPYDGVSGDYVKGIPIQRNAELPDEFLELGTSFEANLLKYIIHTKVGEGPQVLSPDQSLLSKEGIPISIIQ